MMMTWTLYYVILRTKTHQKSENKCERILMAYLMEKKMSCKFWHYDEPTLDKILCNFWFKVRTKTGEKYCINCLKHLRYGLNRCLKKRGHEYSIIWYHLRTTVDTKISYLPQSEIQCFEQLILMIQ